MVKKINGLGNTGIASSPYSGSGDDIAQIRDLKELEKGFYEKLDNYDKKADERQIKSIEVLAIFVAIFTFISIDMQVFKSDISVLSAMGISLITLGSLLLFILVLRWIINRTEFKKSFFIISIILIIVGIFSVSFDYRNYTKKIMESLYTKYDIDKEFIKKSDTFSKEEVKKLIDKNNENSKTLNCLKTKEYFSIKCFDDLSK